jgi:hypothetical protein
MTRTFTLFTLLLLIVSGCRESAQSTPTSAAPDIDVEVSYEPNPPQTGEGTILIAITGEDGQPVEAESVRVRGDMNHAGMVPVMGEEAEQGEDGVYRVPFNWSMGGDWILNVDVVLVDGREISQEIEVTVES